MSIAVVDIDGVVADVRHRLHYLEARPKDWNGFFGAAASDPELAEGIHLVHDLAERHDIVWLTGRPVWLAKVTREWLTRHGLPASDLHMRPSRDRRPARLYKIDSLRRLAARQIGAFIDDDEAVIEAALAAGFPAVLADWVSRSHELREAQDRSGRS